MVMKIYFWYKFSYIGLGTGICGTGCWTPKEDINWKRMVMKIYFWCKISYRIWYRHLWHRMLDPLGGYQAGILIELQTRPSQVTWYDTRPPSRSFHLQHKPICEENQLLVNIYLFYLANIIHRLSFNIGGLLCWPAASHASIFHSFYIFANI